MKVPDETCWGKRKDDSPKSKIKALRKPLRALLRGFLVQIKGLTRLFGVQNALRAILWLSVRFVFRFEKLDI